MDLLKISQLKHHAFISETELPATCGKLTANVINGARNLVQDVECPQVVMVISAQLFDTIPDIALLFDLAKTDEEHSAGIFGSMFGMLVVISDSIENDVAFFGINTNIEVKRFFLLRIGSEYAFSGV